MLKNTQISTVCSAILKKEHGCGDVNPNSKWLRDVLFKNKLKFLVHFIY